MNYPNLQIGQESDILLAIPVMAGVDASPPPRFSTPHTFFSDPVMTIPDPRVLEISTPTFF